MSIWDALGFVAAALVFLAFYQKRMIPLRTVALGSNVAFALGLACRAAAGECQPFDGAAVETLTRLQPGFEAARDTALAGDGKGRNVGAKSG